MKMTREQVREHQSRNGLPCALPVATVAQLETDDFKEPADAYQGPEKDLHALFITDMERRGCHCIHSRTDTAATIEPGLPDVHVMFSDGKRMAACAVEFKRSGGSVKSNQKVKIAEMRKKNIPVLVAWNLRSAIQFARDKLGL